MSRRIAAFIRHADYQQLANTPSALQPFALNQDGIEQAQLCAVQLKKVINQNNWHLDSAIDSSSLLRAWQTANIVSELYDDLFDEPPHITCFEALAERSVGSAANLTTKQIEQIIEDDPRFGSLPKKWKSDSNFKLPFMGAESLLGAGERVAQHLIKQMSALAESSDTQVKLFFGHGAAFRHAAYKLGILEFDEIAQLSMFHASPIYLEYLPNGEWQHIAGVWKVRSQHSEYTD